MTLHQHLQTAILELRRADGWCEFEKTREIVLPLGRKREVVLHNDHLPSRFPFSNLQPSEWGVYPWQRRLTAEWSGPASPAAHPER